METKPDKKPPVRYSKTEMFEKTTDEILQDCVDLRAARKKQYGGNIFKAAARIATAISIDEYEEDDVHNIFLAMKLARYRYQMQLEYEKDNADDEDDDDFCGECAPAMHDEETMCDSLEDAIVYMALMESQRRTENGNHQKRQARHAAKTV